MERHEIGRRPFQPVCSSDLSLRREKRIGAQVFSLLGIDILDAVLEWKRLQPSAVAEMRAANFLSVSSCLCVWGLFEVWVLLANFFKVSIPQSVMGKTVTWEEGNPCLLSFSKDYKWHYFHGHVSDRKHQHDGVFNNAYFLGVFGCLHGILGLNALFCPESCFWIHQEQIFLCHGNVTVKCWMLVRI